MFSITKSVEQRRERMVKRQLEARGITDPLVLAAMRKVPRHLFVAEHLVGQAYDDRPLPIGSRQTISQPFVVALMTQALGLKGGERVLEIGSGSGYAAAVLAEIATEVYSIERIEDLATSAEKRLAELGYENVNVKCGDGTLGWPEAAPFDGIVVTAGGPRAPEALMEQLALGGHLVIPIEEKWGAQALTRITREGEDVYETEDLGGVAFVPLIGEQGWPSPASEGDSEQAVR